jgi:hypothetical protein
LSRVGGGGCSGNSFTATTPVVVGDGSRKAIKDVKIGDMVLAKDPISGVKGPRRVTGLIRHAGAHVMVAVTMVAAVVTGTAGMAAAVTAGPAVVGPVAVATTSTVPAPAPVTTVTDATAGHPFWDVDRTRYVPANELQAGERLQTPTGHTATITSVRTYTANLVAYNLTVDGLHTYYAGTTPVLVHNCGDWRSARGVLEDPAAVEGLTVGQVDDLARNGGYDILPGKAGQSNPATRYYTPGTNKSTGFRVLPGGVAGQDGVKGGAYLRYSGGLNGDKRVPLGE